jgi:hypothetical protein
VTAVTAVTAGTLVTEVVTEVSGAAFVEVSSSSHLQPVSALRIKIMPISPKGARSTENLICPSVGVALDGESVTSPNRRQRDSLGRRE